MENQPNLNQSETKTNSPGTAASVGVAWGYHVVIGAIVAALIVLFSDLTPLWWAVAAIAGIVISFILRLPYRQVVGALPYRPTSRIAAVWTVLAALVAVSAVFIIHSANLASWITWVVAIVIGIAAAALGVVFDSAIRRPSRTAS
jgi:hypothetical protein